jgi:hypothetical protein
LTKDGYNNLTKTNLTYSLNLIIDILVRITPDGNKTSPDKHHAVLVVNIVIGRSVLDHEVLASEGLDVP